MTGRTVAAGIIGSLVATAAVLAHHEWPVDRTRAVTIQGNVTEVSWANPHVMIAVDVQARGTVEHWRVGGSSPQFMTTCGWTRRTLTPGDLVTITGYRYKDGSTTLQLRTLVLPGGQEMYYGAPPGQQQSCVRPKD